MISHAIDYLIICSNQAFSSMATHESFKYLEKAYQLAKLLPSSFQDSLNPDRRRSIEAAMAVGVEVGNLFEPYT